MKQIGKTGRKTTSTYAYSKPLRTAVFTDGALSMGWGAKRGEAGARWFGPDGEGLHLWTLSHG